MQRQKIAVVGAGVSGLSAAWALSRAHDVTLFEADNRLGGHANTHLADTPTGPVPVDTGFIVYNQKNYPNLTALFDHLDVNTHASDMSFALSLKGGAYEYSGSGALGFFGQRRNIFRARHWQLLRDIKRFFATSQQAVQRYTITTSLGKFLQAENYSDVFVNDHILPMGAAIWSSDARLMLDFPVQSFVDFYANHGLMQFSDRPRWRSVVGGSAAYVAKLVEDGDFAVRTNAPVRAVTRSPDGVDLLVAGQGPCRFDQVVMATHADQCLAALNDADGAEQAILGAFKYQTNVAHLHQDARLMPRRRAVWSSWNYLKSNTNSSDALTVTYWMNQLQDLRTAENFFVTLNPPEGQAPRDPLAVISYQHPLFDATATAAQPHLWSLQGTRRTWFCGAHFGYGFHEDGLQSGLAVAEALGGVHRPWQVANPSGRIHVTPAPMEVAAE